MTEESIAPDGRPTAHPLTRDEWREWLAANHATSTGVWVVSFKQSSGKARLTYDDVVEELLCFGWIDSKGNKLDAERSMLWCAPRKPRSAWSRINKQRIEKLLAAGLMSEAGLAVVEAAKQSGRWSALDEVEDLIVPDDLAQAFDALPGAREGWDKLSRSSRRGVLEWISHARRPETRAKRVAETAEQAAQGRAANQWRPSAATS